MTKAEFENRVNAAQTETHDALATVWGELNHGQQQKLLKNEEVVAVLKRYGVFKHFLERTILFDLNIDGTSWSRIPGEEY